MAAALRHEQEISTKLSLETETIGEYVVLYQQQRAIMQTRVTAKEDYIRRCTAEIAKLTATVGDLQQRLALGGLSAQQSQHHQHPQHPQQPAGQQVQTHDQALNGLMPHANGDSEPLPHHHQHHQQQEQQEQQQQHLDNSSIDDEQQPPTSRSLPSSPSRPSSTGHAAHNLNVSMPLLPSQLAPPSRVQTQTGQIQLAWWTKNCSGCRGSVLHI